MPRPARDDPSMELPLVAPLRNEQWPPTSESPPQNTPLSRVGLIQPTDSHRRILGIDIENKPLWYGGGDYIYDNTVCVSYRYVGDPEGFVNTVWLDWTQRDHELVDLVGHLRQTIESADALLGHNFRHDWKGIQAVFNHLKQPFLPWKPILDTMRCIPAGMPRDLEWLCDMFHLGEKPHVPKSVWIAALERKDPEAIRKVRARNRADVILTERLYEKERELGWLTPRIQKTRTPL